MVSIDTRFVELARRYVEACKRKDPWHRALQALADTFTKATSRDGPSFYRELVEKYPTPEAALEACRPGHWAPDGRAYTASLKRAVCTLGRMWKFLKPHLDACNDRAVYNILAGRGFRSKGVDMLLLDYGCPTVVLDRHMIKLFAPGEKVKRVQALPGRYERIRSMVLREAERSGLPPNIFHVAVWLQQAFGGNYEEAEKFVKAYEEAP